MTNLRADHADGMSIAALAAQHRLPADYIEAVLAAPVEEQPAVAAPLEPAEETQE